MNDCTRPFCLWVEDNQHSGQHYVCLKCSRERWVNPPIDGLNVLIIGLAIAFFWSLFAGLGSLEKQPSFDGKFTSHTSKVLPNLLGEDTQLILANNPPDQEEPSEPNEPKPNTDQDPIVPPA